MEQDLKAEGAAKAEGWAEVAAREEVAVGAEAGVLVLAQAVTVSAQNVGQRPPMRSEYLALNRHALSAALP
jgi:hypothetical protein